MSKQKPWFKLCLCSSLLLLNFLSKSVAAENIAAEVLQNATNTDNNASPASEPLPTLSSFIVPPSSTPVETTTTSEAPTTASVPPITTIAPEPVFVAPAAEKSEVEALLPHSLPYFIQKMMIRFGEAKAAEAFQSLDQLPLGLVMKILLVEMDKNLATDIVAMQRYAQNSDKSLITMIGRIVAGDKNVPKEIFAMDLKLMKFPWWMRIRERMLSNLEKYIQAYSLVPVALKTTSQGVDTSDGLSSDLATAVAASATESSNKIIKQVAAAVAPSPTDTSSGSANLESLKLSLLDPLQQQQLLGTLALAKAASDTNAQAQQLFQHTQQKTNINPFAAIFG